MPQYFQEFDFPQETTGNNSMNTSKQESVAADVKSNGRTVDRKHQILHGVDGKENVVLQLNHDDLHRPNNSPMRAVRRSSKPKRTRPLDMNPNQEKFLNKTMQEIRERETELAAKRRKVIATASVTNPVATHHASVETGYNGEIDSNSAANHDEMFAHDDVAQFIATPGGLLTAWNRTFSTLSGIHQPEQSRTCNMPLTIFDLVEPHSLHNLYGMLAVALHGVNIIEVELFSRLEDSDDSACGEVKSTYLTVTLPCKSFTKSKISHNITIIFMNDVRPSKRCFLGIISPSTPPSCDSQHGLESRGRNDSRQSPATPKMPILPLGRLIRVDDDILCNLLYAD